MTSLTPPPPRIHPSMPMPAPAPVYDGPRWNRTRIRRLGPFVALVVPAVVGLIAMASLRWFDGPVSGAIGLIGGVFAAPGLLVVGAPFGNDDLYPIAVAGSAVFWLLVGVVAARRATRNPMATWADFWRHDAWLVAGVWTGAGAALAIAGLAVSDSLF